MTTTHEVSVRVRFESTSPVEEERLAELGGELVDVLESDPAMLEMDLGPVLAIDLEKSAIDIFVMLDASTPSEALAKCSKIVETLTPRVPGLTWSGVNADTRELVAC